MKKQIQKIKFHNKCKKIAVFNTSEIQKLDRNNNYETVISTGLLEIAIAQGYTIIVISSRREFGDHDTWWQSKVQKIYTGYTGYGASDIGLINTWKSFYQDLEIDLNLLELRERDQHYTQFENEYMSIGQSWTDYEDNLSRFGIKRGRDFIPNKKLLFQYLG